MAGTGPYGAGIGLTVPPDTALAHSLSSRDCVLIHTPRENAACHDCSLRDDCRDHANYSGPLSVAGQVVAAAQIVAFDTFQKSALLERAEAVFGVIEQLVGLLFQPGGLPGSAGRAEPSGPGFHGLIGNSAPMAQLRRQILRAAASDSTVLITGETGTGKDLTARAIHAESGRKGAFVAINCGALPEQLAESELFGYGRGAFSGAAPGGKQGLWEAAHGGTLFLDEIGELAPAMQVKLLRALQDGDIRRVGENTVRRFNTRIIAATNRADVLDPALLRPGRFDRQIVVDTPDVKGRQRILEVHAKDKPIGSDVDLAKIAKITPGFTGADLSNLMNESALLTARRGKKIITMREVSESMERVIAGPERKGRVMNEKTKHTIAYHESGHALVGHLLDHADPVHKISIISRGRALGYTLSIPDEDKVLNSLSEMKDELAVFMGGRVAEEIFCDDITTGASNDLERASKMARAIVTQYGMSPLGTQVFGQPNHEVFLGRDYGNTQDYSEETARRIDEEVAKIMKEAHDRAYAILVSHRDQMNLMATVLLERETVEGEACEALLDNKWDEYLAREDDIIAAKEAEEAAARAKDAELMGAAGASVEPALPNDPDAGETLADPNWRSEHVEPGDQDPNDAGRPAAPGADRADMPTQAEVDAEIDREDDMDSTPLAPDPNKTKDE